MSEQALEFGRYDESELLELVESDAYGGAAATTWSCAIVTLISVIGCPTTACTESCPDR